MSDSDWCVDEEFLYYGIVIRSAHFEIQCLFLELLTYFFQINNSKPSCRLDFTSTNPGSTLSIKKGSMKPSNSSSHDEAISVLQIELTDSNAIGPLVIFFLRHHESTKVDSNDSYSSFVLTHDRNHAKLAKEAVREVNKRFSSRNEEQQARTFVGRAGFFEETQSRSGDDDIGGGYSISA